MDQPGKVANPARGQLNRENNIPLSPSVPENLVSRDGFSRPSTTVGSYPLRPLLRVYVLANWTIVRQLDRVYVVDICLRYVLHLNH